MPSHLKSKRCYEMEGIGKARGYDINGVLTSVGMEHLHLPASGLNLSKICALRVKVPGKQVPCLVRCVTRVRGVVVE